VRLCELQGAPEIVYEVRLADCGYIVKDSIDAWIQCLNPWIDGSSQHRHRAARSLTEHPNRLHIEVVTLCKIVQDQLDIVSKFRAPLAFH
jgi:hypothetical protein